MKSINLLIMMLVLVNCTVPKKKIASPVTIDLKKKSKENGGNAFLVKRVPNRIKNFTYVKKVNTYFKNTVSKKRRKRIISKILKKRTFKNKKSRFSQQLKAKSNQFIYPTWSDYFEDGKVMGTIDINMLIGKNGYAEVIIIKEGINLKVDRVFVSYAIKFPFNAAVHKRSKKKARAWYHVKNIFE